MKPLIGIFSVGIEEEFRWKDSVQNDAEIRIWVAEGTANGMKPCFVKFGADIFDKRWMNAVEKMYQGYYKNERYLRNTYEFRYNVVRDQIEWRRQGTSQPFTVQSEYEFNSLVLEMDRALEAEGRSGFAPLPHAP